MTSSHQDASSCQWFARLSQVVDRRSAARLALLFLGALLARGRRTVTSWIRAAGLSQKYQCCHTTVAAAGERAGDIAARLLNLAVRCKGQALQRGAQAQAPQRGAAAHYLGGPGSCFQAAREKSSAFPTPVSRWGIGGLGQKRDKPGLRFVPAGRGITGPMPDLIATAARRE